MYIENTLVLGFFIWYRWLLVHVLAPVDCRVYSILSVLHGHAQRRVHKLSYAQTSFPVGCCTQVLQTSQWMTPMTLLRGNLQAHGVVQTLHFVQPRLLLEVVYHILFHTTPHGLATLVSCGSYDTWAL